MQIFHAKRLFEAVLTLFLGGYAGQQRSQDQLIRKLEKKYGYMIRELHATITTAPKGDNQVLAYEHIVHNDCQF